MKDESNDNYLRIINQSICRVFWFAKLTRNSVSHTLGKS